MSKKEKEIEKPTKQDKLTKEEKLIQKRDKAKAKREELTQQIDELRNKISEETDEKAKKKLRKQRDDLVTYRDSIIVSSDAPKIPLAPKNKKIVRSIIAIVIVVALLAAYFATTVCRNGVTAQFNIPQKALTGITMTDGDGNKHSIKVSTYNYYYATAYNSLQSQQETYTTYGIDLTGTGLDVDFDKKFSDQTTTNDAGETVTWEEYMQQTVLDNIKSTYLYYYEAVKANNGEEPEITDEQTQDIADTLSEYSDTAHSYGYTVDGYLRAAMGKGVNSDVFKREMTIYYISSNYQTEYQTELSKKEYTEDELEAYREDNEDSLKTVSIKIFNCSTEDDAKAFKKALKADGSNFGELALKYTETSDDDDDFDVTTQLNEDENNFYYNCATQDIVKNLGYAISEADSTDDDDEDAEETYSGIDWLFSTKRKAGDIKQYGETVVYVVKPVSLDKGTTYNVRHILVTPETDDDGNSTEENWADCYEQAKEILDEYNEGDKTSESFAELAQEYSEDSNADEGGIYENVYGSQMLPTFNGWVFDSSRKDGDVGIVQTKYGYHIIRFEGKGTLKNWQGIAQAALASEDYEPTITALEASYTIDTNWFGSRYFEKDIDIDS